MTKQSFWLVVLLILFASLFGYNYFKKPFAHLQQNIAASQVDRLIEESAVPAASPTPQQQKKLLVEAFTPRQKIAQLLAVALVVDEKFKDEAQATLSAQLQWIKKENPGTVVLFGSKVSSDSAKQAVRLIMEDDRVGGVGSVAAAPLRPLIAVDHEGGTVQRLAGQGFSPLKSWAQLCSQDRIASQIEIDTSARELAAVGIDVILGPMLDVGRANAALGTRLCSDDFQLVNDRVRLAASIYQSHNLVPVFKHFPGIGQVTKDLHTAYATVLISQTEASLYVDLLNFFKAQPLGVMIAHVGVENQDPLVPCSLSANCVGQLTSAFSEVLIFTDDLVMKSAYQGLRDDQKTLYQVALKALIAGNQQLIIGPGVSPDELNQVLLMIEDSYRSNSFVKAVIDSNFEKVIDFKLKRI